MQVDETALSLPPFLSTSWDNVLSIHMEVQEMENEDPSDLLIVTLISGTEIEIPGLSDQLVDKIFEAHSNYLKKASARNTREEDDEMLASITLPMSIGIPSESGMMTIMDHTPEQSHLADLPKEMLARIAGTLLEIGIPDDATPKGEPHCNCPYCQIAREIAKQKNGTSILDELEEEEEVSDSDLKFRDWDVIKEDEKLYSVKNPFDHTESYSVFLGSPLCCTCGLKNCAHIKAVLET